jgi:hypothetical protein
MLAPFIIPEGGGHPPVNRRPLAAQLIPFAARTCFAGRESSGHFRSPSSGFNAGTECAITSDLGVPSRAGS